MDSNAEAVAVCSDDLGDIPNHRVAICSDDWGAVLNIQQYVVMIGGQT